MQHWCFKYFRLDSVDIPSSRLGGHLLRHVGEHMTSVVQVEDEISPELADSETRENQSHERLPFIMFLCPRACDMFGII